MKEKLILHDYEPVFAKNVSGALPYSLGGIDTWNYGNLCIGNPDYEDRNWENEEAKHH